MVIQPLESVALHQADLGRMDALRLSLQPAGYEATETFSVPAAHHAADGANHSDEGTASAVRTVMVRLAACLLAEQRFGPRRCCFLFLANSMTNYVASSFTHLWNARVASISAPGTCSLCKSTGRLCCACLRTQVHESGEGRGSTDVRVKHVVEAAGNHVIRFCCALWVYNCTGLPIALQQVSSSSTFPFHARQVPHT